MLAILAIVVVIQELGYEPNRISTVAPAIPTLFLDNKDALLDTIVQDTIVEQSEIFGIDPNLAMSIISCEGGFETPGQCNATYGCVAGQGHFQFIPSTWQNIIDFNHSPLPSYCRNKEAVFVSECNIIAGAWLLSTDGDIHWRAWSGACYIPKL